MAKSDEMILGENCVYSMDSRRTGLNNNVIVCGTSGCGKTMSISEPKLLHTFDTSLIVTVTKNRLVQKYRGVLAQLGYEVMDLNFVSPDRSDAGYDPLRNVRNYQDVRFCARSIVMGNSRKEGNTTADPYWDEIAISLLCAIIAKTMMTDRNATLADVLDVFDRLSIKDDGSSIKTTLDEEFAALEKRNPTCYAIKCWKSFRQLPYRTAGCAFSTLSTTIDSIFTSEVRKLMRKKKQVDFARLASRKAVLFVTTSPVNPSLNSFINMFYSSAFKELFEIAEKAPDGRLPVPVHLLCDDFATGGRIPNFPEYISIFREKGVSVTLMIQSESQLVAMYGPESATTIINNCDSYVYMGGMDLQTAKNISQKTNRPLDEILYMPIGQEIVLRRGERPRITRRYDILRDKQYREVTGEYEKALVEEAK